MTSSVIDHPSYRTFAHSFSSFSLSMSAVSVTKNASFRSFCQFIDFFKNENKYSTPCRAHVYSVSVNLWFLETNRAKLQRLALALLYGIRGTALYQAGSQNFRVVSQKVVLLNKSRALLCLQLSLLFEITCFILPQPVLDQSYRTSPSPTIVLPPSQFSIPISPTVPSLCPSLRPSTTPLPPSPPFPRCSLAPPAACTRAHAPVRTRRLRI